MIIAVSALGHVEENAMNELVMDLRSVFSREVVEGPALPGPRYAFEAGRGQFNSTAILNAMDAMREFADFERALGVVDADLFASGLNFVFGEAGSKVAVIALGRLKEGFYGRPDNRALLRRRALVEAVHELGHTYGLGHCRDPFCVMYFSVTLSDTDRKGYGFRGGCLKRMRELGLVAGLK